MKIKIRTILFLIAIVCVITREEDKHKHSTVEEVGKGIHYHEEEPSGGEWQKDLFWSNENYKDTLQKLGLDKKKSLTADDIRKYVSSLFGLDECESDTSSYKDFFDSFSKNLPKSLSFDDLKTYLNSTDFIKSVKDYFKDQPDILKTLNTKFKSSQDMFQSFKNLFTPKDHVSFWDSELFKNIDTKLGLSQKSSLNKDDVRNFLSHIIGEEVVKGEHKDKFNMVIDLFLKELPDTISLEDLKMTCLNMRFIGPLLKAFVGEPTIMEKVKYSFKNNWNDFSHGLGHLFQKDESYFDSPVFKEILSKLGLEQKDEITKEDIKSLLTHIVGENIVRGQFSDIFNAIFESYTKDIPDKIKMSTLKVFLYQHDLPRTVMKFFGAEPTVIEKLKYNAGVSWMNMSKYFKSAFGNEESFWDSPEFKIVLKKLGWAEDRRLKKDDIRHLLVNLIGEEHISEQNKAFFENVFDLFVKDFPDELGVKDLKEYMDHNKLIQAVRKYFFKEPTTYEKVKTFLWNNMGQYFTKVFKKKEENFWTSSVYDKISSALNWKNKESFNRNDIIEFFNKMLEGKIPEKYKKDFNEIYERYLKDLPDKLTLANLGEFLDIQRFTDTIRDYFTTKHPEEWKDKFTKLTDTTWFNLTDYFNRIFESGKSFWNESSLASSIKELGFSKKTKLSRDEMYTLVKKLIFGKDAKIPAVIDDVLRAYIKQLPDNVPATEIPDHMDWTKFINAIKEVAIKKYGKSSIAKFQPLFDSTKMNLTDILFQVFNYTLKHEEL